MQDGYWAVNDMIDSNSGGKNLKLTSFRFSDGKKRCDEYVSSKQRRYEDANHDTPYATARAWQDLVSEFNSVFAAEIDYVRESPKLATEVERVRIYATDKPKSRYLLL